MRVVLDCDPGIDDTYALLYLTAAAHMQQIELECVTTTSGNVDADQCARNAAWILSLCSLPTIPLAAGMPEPFEWELTTTPETHGATGLGYSTAPERHIEHDWNMLWCDAIDRGTDDLHLIITGPLTNLAAFARQHPAHYARLRHITVMGGAFNYPGNTTPSAEWNFWVDPHAAKESFASTPVPITVCPLNVTEQMILTPERLTGIVDMLGPSPIAQHLEPMTRFYFEFHRDVGEGYCAQIHDLLTVLVALGLVPHATRLSTIDVEPDSPLTRGTSIDDAQGIWEREPNARVLEEADTEAAWRAFADACRIHARAAAGDGEMQRMREMKAED